MIAGNAPMAPEELEEVKATVRGMAPAARLAIVMDLFAPEDEDGVRHPECGLITREQARELLDTRIERRVN